MIVDRYYYHQLNKQEQAIYRAFYNGVMAHQDIIPIPVRGDFPEETFHRIFMAMTRDNPLIYYLNQSVCSCASDMFGRKAICPQYFFSRQKVKEYNRKIEKEVNRLAEILKLTEGSDYEKEIKVHDWICRNVLYDYEGSDTGKPARMIAAHNIIGVFAHHRAQCEGIAKAVKVLLNAVDVKCLVITGNSTKSGKKVLHAWNMVNLNGQPYHLDVTWDIGAINKSFPRIPYDYFNVSDKMIFQDHTADTKLPKCSSMKHNYFVVNGINFQKKKQLLNYIDRGLKSGRTEFYFRIEDNRQNISVVSEEICQMASVVLEENGNIGKRVKRILNEEIGTCWIKFY